MPRDDKWPNERVIGLKTLDCITCLCAFVKMKEVRLFVINLDINFKTRKKLNISFKHSQMHLYLSQIPLAFWHSVNVNILPSIYKQLNEVWNSRTNQNIPKMREFHKIESKRKCNFVNYRCCVKMMFFRNSKFCFSNFASGFLFLFTGKQTRLFTRKIALAIGHL